MGRKLRVSPRLNLGRFEKAFQLPDPGRVAHLAQRLGLDLPDALPGDLELPSHLLERAAVAVHEAEPLFEHLALARSLRRWMWQFALGGTCAAAVAATLVTAFPGAFVRHHHTASVQSGLARQIVGNPDYEVINHLDELVADEESSLWLDDSAHSLH